MTEALPQVVIVSGARDWTDKHALWGALDEVGPQIIIHGACGLDAETWQRLTEAERKAQMRGADLYAHVYCALEVCTVLPMPAAWTRLGKAAGPKRNEAMLGVGLRLARCGYRLLVVACPPVEARPSGTRNLMGLARKAGIPVREVRSGP